MAYNFGGKQQSQQITKIPANKGGKGSGVTIDAPTYKPIPSQPEPPQPQKQPTNTNIEGNVSFNKTIYSRTQFDKLVNSEFDELTQRQDTFNIDQLFNQYNRLFFDIPKEGPNSHRTLIENSSEYLGGFSDPRDGEIARLNTIISDLQIQLATSTTDVNTVREHPFFKNGTIVIQQDSANGYYMDKGFKRLIAFSEGDVFWRLVYDTLGYKVGINEPPEAPVSILNQILSGPTLTPDNFGEEFIPPNEAATAAQEFAINLDPTDAALSPERIDDLYGSDYEAYRIALENDYTEKTIAIQTIQDKIDDPNTSPEEIIGYNIGLASLISRRSTITQILDNFDLIINGVVIANVIPNITNEDLLKPEFRVKITKQQIIDAINNSTYNLGLQTAIKNRLNSITSLPPTAGEIANIQNSSEDLESGELYYALWINYNSSQNNFSGQGANTQAAQDGLEQILKGIYGTIQREGATLTTNR
jgi:hypothetical protein